MNAGELFTGAVCNHTLYLWLFSQDLPSDPLSTTNPDRAVYFAFINLQSGPSVTIIHQQGPNQHCEWAFICFQLFFPLFDRSLISLSRNTHKNDEDKHSVMFSTCRSIRCVRHLIWQTNQMHWIVYFTYYVLILSHFNPFPLRTIFAKHFYSRHELTSSCN